MSGKSGRIALELRGYSRAFGDQVLFANVDLHLSYGERVGVERELAAAYRDSDYKLGEPPRPVPAPR